MSTKKTTNFFLFLYFQAVSVRRLFQAFHTKIYAQYPQENSQWLVFSLFLSICSCSLALSLSLFLCIHLYTRRSFFVVVEMTRINFSFIHLLAFCLVNYFYTVHSYLYWEYLLSSHNHNVFVWIFFSIFFISWTQSIFIEKTKRLMIRALNDFKWILFQFDFESYIKKKLF